MANSDLYGKTTYRVPDGVLADIRVAAQRHPGNQRAQNLLASPKISYENAKKLKHDLEVTNEGSPEYILAGGKSMLDWLNRMLGHDRSEVTKQKTVRSNAGFENQFRKTHERSSLKATDFSVSRLKPEKPKAMSLFETEDEIKATAAVGVIVNPESKFLLMKRADHDDWMPGKWALPGGGIDGDETPEEALVREIMEEAGLVIEAIKAAHSVIRKDGQAHCAFLMAVCRNPEAIKLDPNEHSEHQWVTEVDLASMDCVPDVARNVALVKEAYRKTV